MKCLIIVIHETAQENLVELLSTCNTVRLWHRMPALGHYDPGTGNPFETALDQVSGRVPRMRFEILLEEEGVDPVLKVLSMCRTCLKGRGLFWVTEVDQFGEF